MGTAAAELSSNPKGRFSTMSGVFTPCVLTILGVIMFMRSGFVLGYSGLWLGLIILGVSKVITLLTALSLSAISTNTRVGSGGVYYMISRTLGPDFGGAIGLTLYFAQAVGVSFYIIGFTEAFLGSLQPLLHYFGSDPEAFAMAVEKFKVPQLISSGVTVVLFYLTFKGADLALKVQNIVLVILLISVASFLVGGFLNFDAETFRSARSPSFGDGIGFWTAFAIFFPAVTGITAGANMSGDLKTPEKSIPRGTLLAIAFTFVIYLAQFVLMSGTIDRESLKNAPFESVGVMSVFSPLIILGVFAATLSSALSSFLGAPRILQAMGRDRLMYLLKFFSRGVGPSDEPVRAAVLTFVLALGVIWAGDLNAVAEIISMFFLIAYGMINLSAFVESRGGNPSFRPQFRFFHWAVALAGAVGCVVVMMKINDTYALIALVIAASLYFYLKKRNIKTSYGDAKRGYVFKSICDNLSFLEGTKAHPKNWRPVIVAVCNDPSKEIDLLRATSWIESRRGLYSILALQSVNDLEIPELVSKREELLKKTSAIIKKQGFFALPEVLLTRDSQQALFHFLQCNSIGALKANSISLGYPDSTEGEEWAQFMRTVEIVASFNQNLVIYKKGTVDQSKKGKTIDIWWRGETNGSLMALFAYLMTLNTDWVDAKVRLLRSLNPGEDQEEALKRMNDLIRLARIEAAVTILPQAENVFELIKETSSNKADLVFLGMGATDSRDAEKSIEKIRPHLDQLPACFLVWSNGEANIFA